MVLKVFDNQKVFIKKYNIRIFNEPLVRSFDNTPRNTGSLDNKLYEDLNGDGDGLDTEQTVKWFGKLIRDEDYDDKFDEKQIELLDWSKDGKIKPDDAVRLFGKQIRS